MKQGSIKKMKEKHRRGRLIMEKLFALNSEYKYNENQIAHLQLPGSASSLGLTEQGTKSLIIILIMLVLEIER